MEVSGTDTSMEFVICAIFAMKRKKSVDILMPDECTLITQQRYTVLNMGMFETKDVKHTEVRE